MEQNQDKKHEIYPMETNEVRLIKSYLSDLHIELKFLIFNFKSKFFINHNFGSEVKRYFGALVSAVGPSPLKSNERFF